MRADADRARITRLLDELGKHSSSGDRVYLAGGTSAVLVGWREFTQDVDLRIESANDEPLLRAISELKERLDVNVELASPLDFLPAPPGWQERSPFERRHGALDAYHLDFSLQALAKLERGFERDLADIDAMIERRLTSPAAIRATFTAVAEALYRFPAVDQRELQAAVQALGRTGA